MLIEDESSEGSHFAAPNIHKGQFVMTFTDFAIWFIFYPLSTLLFVFLAVVSLEYRKVKNSISDEEFSDYLNQLRFPKSIIRNVYQNVELANSLLPSMQTSQNLLIPRIIWVVFILILLSFLLLSVMEATNACRLLLALFWIIVYLVLTYYAWNFGDDLIIV